MTYARKKCKLHKNKVLKGNKDVIKNYNKVRTYARAHLIEKRGRCGYNGLL